MGFSERERRDSAVRRGICRREKEVCRLQVRWSVEERERVSGNGGRRRGRSGEGGRADRRKIKVK